MKEGTAKPDASASKPMQVTLRQIGNSQGIVIPKLLLAQVGLENEVDMTVEAGALVLRRPARPARVGWAEAARDLAQHGDDSLLLGDIANDGDAELAW